MLENAAKIKGLMLLAIVNGEGHSQYLDVNDSISENKKR